MLSQLSINKVKTSWSLKLWEDIAVALKEHDEETHWKGENLPEEQNVYRVKVMALMKAGIPIGKLDCAQLRALFEVK